MRSGRACNNKAPYHNKIQVPGWDRGVTFFKGILDRYRVQRYDQGEIVLFACKISSFALLQGFERRYGSGRSWSQGPCTGRQCRGTPPNGARAGPYSTVIA